ncbi:MAG: ATP-dependent DNA helicase RecG [Pseudomonadota bacterium]
MGRPEILFSLFAGVDGLKGVGPSAAKALARLGIATRRDLLFHLPTGTIDRRPVATLEGVEPGQVVTFEAAVMGHTSPRRRGAPYRVTVEGAGAVLDVLFFRAVGDWLTRLLPEGELRVISGKIDRYNDRWQIAHPEIYDPGEDGAGPPDFEPVYPLAEGLTQRQMAKLAGQVLDALPMLPDWHDPALAKREGWPDWPTALARLHRPQPPEMTGESDVGESAMGEGDAAAMTLARRRLAYDELLSHQLALALSRQSMRKRRGRQTIEELPLVAKAAAAFPFPPTGAQRRALDEIRADMGHDDRMMRLLQGDVGAGKTWVATMALMIAVSAGGQGVMMAPTEILARQHGRGLAAAAEAAGVELVVLTGRDSGAERRDKLEAIASGRAGIIVGTHALFSGDVAYADLRLAVVDEQHRFGVRQRMELTAKAPAGCDLLLMTATPIPRTLALAGYGDLDISVLDEKPPGRQPVETRTVPSDRLEAVIERLRVRIDDGGRAYWVCPLVEENPETEGVAAAERAATLAEALGAHRVALVHGQMPAEARDRAMADFKAGRAQVLVATTVIEVGVDVPEATIMVIEQAERFGLAQLHQLRGRVGRGSGASFCLLVYDPPLGETAASRLQILRDSEDGFAIAERDLELRGAGDLMGTAQSGLPRFRLADLERDQALMAIAHDDARRIMATDPALEGPRGRALRTLLYLMERDASVRLLRAG